MAPNLPRAWEVGGEGQTLDIGSYRFWQGATSFYPQPYP